MIGFNIYYTARTFIVSIRINVLPVPRLFETCICGRRVLLKDPPRVRSTHSKPNSSIHTLLLVPRLRPHKPESLIEIQLVVYVSSLVVRNLSSQEAIIARGPTESMSDALCPGSFS